MPKAKHALTTQQRALLFSHLAQLESAGLPATAAANLLTGNATCLKTPLTALQHTLKTGQPLSKAGLNAGLFTSLDSSFIQAAEASGLLAVVYQQRAAYYSAQHSRQQRLIGRLYFPLLSLVLALFIAPLPELIGARITAVEYLQHSLGRLCLMALGVLSLYQLPDLLHQLGVDTAWHRLQLRTPLVKQWLIKRQINDCLHTLAFLLTAGLPYADALPKAVATIHNSQIRLAFKPALLQRNSGGSVYTNLASVPLLQRVTLQIIQCSEHSGKLASGLLLHTQQNAEYQSLEEDSLAEWLPRLLYSMIALGMAYALLESSILPSAIPTG